MFLFQALAAVCLHRVTRDIQKSIIILLIAQTLLLQQRKEDDAAEDNYPVESMGLLRIALHPLYI